MSDGNPRSSYPQLSYMTPTNASNARFRNSTSRSSSGSPVTTPNSPASSSTMKMRASQQSSPQTSPDAHPTGIPKKRSSSGVSKISAAPTRASDKIQQKQSSSNSSTAKSAMGSFVADGSSRMHHDNMRAAEEDRMGAEMARIAKENDLIDDETAKNWSTEWHVKGELQQQWSEDIRKKQNADAGAQPASEEIMSLEEAKRIKAKKDAELEEWCAAFEAGVIDEQGLMVATGEEFEAGDYNRYWKAKGRDAQQHKKPQKKAETKTASLSKVVDDEATKPVATKKTSELTIIDKSDIFADQATTKKTEKVPKKGTKIPSSGNAPSDSESPSDDEKLKASSLNDDDFCLLPLPNQDAPLPNYQELNYYKLTALLRERNIRSGGRVERCRNRLIQDDIYIVTGQWDKRDARNWKHQNREVKTNAPKVPNMPVAPPAKFTAAMTQARQALNENPAQDKRHPYAPIKPKLPQAGEGYLADTSKMHTANNKRVRNDDEDEDEDGDDGSPSTSKKLRTV